MKGQLPGGSWRQTARNYHIERGFLYAELKRKDGSWNRTKVPLKAGNSFKNNNGHF